MNKLKEFFKQIKWYEYLIIASFCVSVLIVGILFGSTAMIIVDSILGITYIFLNAKGFLIANLFGLTRNILYAIICINNRYYGEVVVCCVSIVVIIITFITWYKNRANNSINLKIGKAMSWQNYLILFACMAVVPVGIYFMLKAFNTQNLIISTLSVTLNLGANILLAKRLESNFYVFMANNIMCFVLWLLIVLKGEMSYIPTLINIIVFFTLNIFGVINWNRLKKQQRQAEIENLINEKQNKE